MAYISTNSPDSTLFEIFFSLTTHCLQLTLGLIVINNTLNDYDYCFLFVRLSLRYIHNMYTLYGSDRYLVFSPTA